MVIISIPIPHLISTHLKNQLWDILIRHNNTTLFFNSTAHPTLISNTHSIQHTTTTHTTKNRDPTPIPFVLLLQKFNETQSMRCKTQNSSNRETKRCSNKTANQTQPKSCDPRPLPYPLVREQGQVSPSPSEFVLGSNQTTLRSNPLVIRTMPTVPTLSFQGDSNFKFEFFFQIPPIFPLKSILIFFYLKG